MKYLFSFLLIFCALLPAQAQTTYTIKGAVTDTLNNARLYRASVVLVRNTDTVIETFTRTASDGSFSLAVPKTGKYTLQISFPSFAEYVEVINVKKQVTDLGTVAMVSKEHLLQEFVLTKNIAAIKIKGDTTEYMADSFKVKENATVEDLLKKLPGIQVDKNGQITAQGETVQKVLVDGEEFFSDDPKVVTKGLAANAVEKVQVYNKKSEQAEFTGIDDGLKTKTINLELKEDKKKGYFGKLDAGAGTDGYFQEQAMINAFKAKRQVSAFGIASNTDKVGLGWTDRNKYSSGNGTTEITEDGGMMTYYTDNGENDFGGWDGKYSGEGLPKTWTGGLHYADKWDADKNHITGNYRYAQQNVEIDGNNIQQYTRSGDTSNVNQQHKNQFSKGEKHAIDFMYERKLDSSSTLKINVDAGQKNNQTASDYVTNSTLLYGDYIDTLNRNKRHITSNTDGRFFNSDLIYRKKFAKKGRTLSIDVKENYKENNSDGYLNSLTDIYKDIKTGNRDTTYINQSKINKSTTTAFSGKATYTEPLSKITFLELDYGATINNSQSSNLSYNLGSTNKYDNLDSTFSSNYKYNIFSNTAGANLRFVIKKVNFSFGTDVSDAQYVQTNYLLKDATRKYGYQNFYPKASFKYKISNQSSFNISYNGSTEQPTINQVAPLAQNTDPTNITKGNTNLRQEFNNNIYFQANDYKVLTNRYFYMGGNIQFTNDAISTARTTVNGINTTQYINVDGNKSANSYMGYGYKLKKLDVRLGGNLNLNVNHVVNYVNGQKNESNNNSYTLGLDVTRYKDEKFDISVNPSVTYNDNKATISTYSSNYWNGKLEVSGTFQLPKKFDLGTNADFIFRQKTTVFTENNNIIKWNAWVGKKFLEKGQLEVRLIVYDILNQNIGYSRYANAGVITQNDYNTIRRYGMVNLIWNFTHTPAGAPKQQGETIIIKQ